MSEIHIRGTDLVSDCLVYDLFESIKASKYPMATDIASLDNIPTERTCSLGSSEVGAGHDNFLNGVRVAFDLKLTNKAWVEAERYHFFDFVSSQSTMHRITKFDLASQCCSYVDPCIIKILQEHIDTYNRLSRLSYDELDCTREEHTERCKEAYLKVLYNIPSGFQLTARITTDYRQLKTIYYQRKNHRLPEWREFCKWMETLPLFDEMVLGIGGSCQ